MRLFIAIDVNNLCDFFTNLQTKIKGDEATIKYTNSYHLTLKFLGEVADTSVDRIKQLLEKVDINPFLINFSTIGHFTPKKIKVIWVGLENNKSVIKLQQEVDNSLTGFYAKEKRFHPHITLGRVKHVKDNNLLKKKIENINFKPSQFQVKSFKLIKSTLTLEGPIYKDIWVAK
ncbi:RNA 2',3'-cyclic phosphodiesterase [Patescibacteria group bacterium]|nr:RNA 2',3'-cyclic phosphodiesterase [Patescibacteria group bacterium]